jgi:hypothetical protein
MAQIPPPNEFLWCSEHAEIAAWLTKNNLGLEFYGSFINYCVRSIDKLRNVNNRLIKSHLEHLRQTLMADPLSDTAVLHEMKFYHKRFYKNGLVMSGAYPLNVLCKFYLTLTSDDGDSSIPSLPWLLM